MKRDLDLCRKILEVVEEGGEFTDSGTLKLRCAVPDCGARDPLPYHVELLIEAGLLFRASARTHGDEIGSVSLTWPGHEFIDQARKPEVWEKAKRTAGVFGFEVLKGVLVELCKNATRLAL